MAGYGWTVYDVRKGGTQIVNDTGNKLDLITDISKVSDGETNGNWGLRIKGIPRANARNDQNTTLIVYLGSESSESRMDCTNGHRLESSNSNVVCDGTMFGLGSFKIDFPGHGPDSGALQKRSISSLTVPEDTIWQAKSIFTDLIKSNDSHEGVIADNPGPGNLHFVQETFEGGFELDVLFSSNSTANAMTSHTLTKGIQDARSAFSERFESVYAPQAPFQDEEHIKFSQSLLSNLMGGIGYFDGTSKVDVSSAPEYAETDKNFWDKAKSARSRAVVEERGPYQLFTAVPSRPFFPRGFLWDEGFHLEVILDWDIDLALEIVSSWFDLMDESGWIAREQILGPEARTKVPSEFQTQYPHYANPPTLFLVVEAFLAKSSGMSSYHGAVSQYLNHPELGTAFLKAIYPKMEKHYEWFCRTQAGNMKNYQLPDPGLYQGYRWRGRTPQHVLTSGLDDYPRAQPPHPEELHLDAICWVGSMAVALKKISAFLGEKKEQNSFSKHEADVIRSLDGIHWSEPNQAYCDTTVINENQVERVCHKGYISLFPFLVNLMGPDHSHLEAMLNLIRDPEELWSPHGLRSLSPKDEYYGTGENYWRSPVWININYMVLQRLLVSLLRVVLAVPLSHSSFNRQDLAQQPGPYQQKALKIYTELRMNLGTTVFNSWNETGFAWEQYNPDTGKGQRTQHFTGWTAFIVRILAMPELQSLSRPQMPGYSKQRTDRDGWNNRLYLMALGWLLICFVFRRRLVRSWKAIKVL